MAAVLVTGGAGFLGSHLCDRLLAANHKVTCLDDLSTGNRTNLADALRNSNFHFTQADVTQPLSGSFERIYHLACPASPVAYRVDPVRTLQVAAVGTLRVLELAKRCGARVLLASTSEVYGEPLVHPQPEDYRGNVDTQSTRACYDEGKRAAETLAADFHRNHGVQVRVARIFNTYGPRMATNDGRVVSNFIVAALAGAPLRLTGGGKQSRSFCFVDDLIGGLMALMECEAADSHRPVNLGTPHEISVRQLAERVIELVGSTSALTDSPGEEGDPSRRCPDIARARKLLNFSPHVALDDGLRRTIETMRGQVASSR